MVEKMCRVIRHWGLALSHIVSHAICCVSGRTQYSTHSAVDNERRDTKACGELPDKTKKGKKTFITRAGGTNICETKE